MNTRVFYTVGFENSDVQRILDAIRLFANPSEKGVAHITVRGPYRRHLSESLARDFAAAVKGTTIDILGVGSFFGVKQNTVFLACDGDAIRQVWKKQHYGYNPHVTLYDSNVRSEAEEVLSSLSSLDLHFSCRADEMLPYVSHKGQSKLDLRYAFDEHYISGLLCVPVTANAVVRWAWPERLKCIMKLASMLKPAALASVV